MFKILKKEYLANNIWLMDIEAPRVAKHCQPGQFVIVKTDEKGEDSFCMWWCRYCTGISTGKMDERTWC